MPPRRRLTHHEVRGRQHLDHSTVGAISFVLLSLLISSAWPAAADWIGRVHPEGNASPIGPLAGTLGAAGSGSPDGGLNLSISTSPSSICVNDTVACSANAGSATVHLEATANGSGYTQWPAVTMVFVLETTPFDGVYDPTSSQPGNDECARNPTTLELCEPANGVPFFAANAGEIATSLAADHPDTHFTFGLVDYAASHDQWDDRDGTEYHVDVGDPVPASEFGAAVNASLVTEVLTDGAYIVGSDMRDNFLESSSITALYGVLEGAGIAWTNDSHHVIVWMGSTAPRDPNYPEDYCGTETAYNALNLTGSACYAPSCEPSYSYGIANLVSPNCEGWIVAQDGNAGDSIARLANGGAPSCDFSLGGNCTIDSLELWTGTTDVNSPGDWWAAAEPGPDANSITGASCQIANVTGGSWDGPAFDNCGITLNRTQHGTLDFSRERTYDVPNTTDPTLSAAFLNVSLGSPPTTLSDSGGPAPMFTFVTVGNIQLDPYDPSRAICTTLTGTWDGCQQNPTVLHEGGRSVLEWNWSIDPNGNDLVPGDIWRADVPVIATGPPFQTPVPVDSCTTSQCLASHSAPVGAYSTVAAYRDPGSATALSYSFPLSQITVVSNTGSPLSNGAPPPPPATGIPPPVVLPTPVPSPLPAPAAVGVLASPAVLVAIQPAAVGLIAAGFTRVWLRARPNAMRVGLRSGVVPSRFDEKSQRDADRQARFD